MGEFIECSKNPPGGGWQQDKALMIAIENTEKVTFYAGLKRQNTGKMLTSGRNFLISGRNNQEIDCDYDPPGTLSPTPEPSPEPTLEPTPSPIKICDKCPCKNTDTE